MAAEDCRSLVHNAIFRLPLLTKKLIKEEMFEDIDIRKLRVLMMSDRLGPMNMTEYSRNLILPKSNCTLIVNELVKEGYVDRRYDDKDRRLVYLEITKRGKAFLDEKMRLVEGRWSEHLSSTLSEEDIRTLNTYMEKTISILSKL